MEGAQGSGPRHSGRHHVGNRPVTFVILIIVSLGPKTTVLLSLLTSYLRSLTILSSRDGLSAKSESQDNSSGWEEVLHSLPDNEVCINQFQSTSSIFDLVFLS
jgi:hypothetical protein